MEIKFKYNEFFDSWELSIQVIGKTAVDKLKKVLEKYAVLEHHKCSECTTFGVEINELKFVLRPEYVPDIVAQIHKTLTEK